MVAKSKRESRGNFGWLCSYTPVEILVAAGWVPVRLDAGDMLLQKPNPNIYQMLCPYVRAVFDTAQEKGFGPLEGVLFTKCCDAMLRLYDLWKAHLPEQRSYILPVPKIQSSEAIDYFAAAIRRFSDSLGDDLGAEVSPDSLSRAIADLNRLRSAFQRLYSKRLKNPQAMTYSKLRLMVRECLSMAPDQALLRVQRALEVFDESPSAEALPEARVLVSSSTLDQLGIVDLMEAAGMTVVADDHCSGLRHFDDLVDEEGDPYLNLAKRYLNRWPCSRMQANPSHLERLVQEIDGVGGNGVIYVGLKYCDQSGFEVPRLQSHLNERHIPFLYIENDYTASGLGQLKVRIEAFAEMLREEL